MIIMLLLNLNKTDSKPLFQQVVDQIKSLIEQGVLREGEALPATRKLADRCGVNRTTITKAYEELWAMGYLESSQGSYSYVRLPQFARKELEHQDDSGINWSNSLCFNRVDLYLMDEWRINATGMINFRSLSPDPRLMPTEDFRKCLNQHIANHGTRVLNYGDARGYDPLIKYISKHQQLHQIHASEDQIILTNGAQHALDLICRLYIDENTTIAIGRPSYNSAIQMFKSVTSNIIEIPLNDEGLDLDELEFQAQKKQIKMVYTMPNFQNPTGITTSMGHREQLLEICEKYDMILIEDGFEEEMKYFDKAVLPIKSIDRNHHVIYLGTFSKVLFPGLRLGWITAHRDCIQQLSAFKTLTELSGNQLSQSAVYGFCKSGKYDLHKKRFHKAYKKRMTHTLKMIREYIPEEVKTSIPMGGYLIWFELPNLKLSEKELINRLLKNKILVAKGSDYYASHSDNLAFRLSIAHTDEEEITEGIKRIAQVINSI